MAYGRIIHRTIGAVALAMACYHLWVAFAGPPNALVLRSVHVGFALTLAFLALPARKRDPNENPSYLDLALVALAIAAAAYPVLYIDYFLGRMY
jgi:TRAP-type uncharacterized transport system fused permease subunit